MGIRWSCEGKGVLIGPWKSQQQYAPIADEEVVIGAFLLYGQKVAAREKMI